jgi:hypothetical protein
MNKKDFKEIISYIQKSAQPKTPPARRAPPPRGSAPASGSTPAAGPTGSTVRTGPVRGGAPSTSATPGTGRAVVSNDISKMQAAIKDFAKEAAQYTKIPVGKDNQGKIITEVSKEDKRRDFNDFLAEQFMSSADIHGQEYNTDPKATSKESKLPTDIIQMEVVINGLDRIGPSGSEKLVDGMWDFRTNNAVKNVYAFAAALVASYEALGNYATNDPNLFTKADLEKLKAAIPKEYDPAKQKISQDILNQNAKNITPLVEKLSSFYQICKKNVMDHPAYKQYIDQDAAMYNFTPGGTNPYKPDPNDPKQKTYMDNPKSFTIPVLTLTDKDGSEVNLNNKITLESFQSLNGIATIMTQHLGYSPKEISNPKLLTTVVRSILDQVNKFLEKNKSKMPASSQRAIARF